MRFPADLAARQSALIGFSYRWEAGFADLICCVFLREQPPDHLIEFAQLKCYSFVKLMGKNPATDKRDG